MKWAAILAGGNGTRLQALTRGVTGDDRPKQFCPLLNGQTLLAHTRLRLAMNVHPARTLTVVTRTHQSYYRQELADVPATRILEQPGDLGTAAAVAFSVARVSREDRAAVLGIFPADHYYDDVNQFSQILAATYRAAVLHPDRVFLLGAEPSTPETEYGWIEPGPPLGTGVADTFAVTKFWEKPSAAIAVDLLERGCLWNMFVMVGGLSAFRGLLESAAPDLARAFELVEIAPAAEVGALDRIYGSQPPVDFSRDVLTHHADGAAVVRVPDIGWTDLGQPARVFQFLRQHGSAMPAADAIA